MENENTEPKDANENGTDGHRKRRKHRGGARWLFVVLGTVVAVSTAGVVGHAIASGDGHRGGWGARAGHGPGVVLFQNFDADTDGKVTTSELKSSVASRISGNDADNDGALSLDEFEGVWNEFMRKPMVRAFQKFDDDGDGELTQAELDQKIEWMMARIDRNDDGAISRREISKRHHHDDDHDDD